MTGETSSHERAADVAIAAQLACLLEVSAPKPGNVSPGRPFADMAFHDFLASAAAIGGSFQEAGDRPLGQTIRRAVETTARWTGANTNLGIVLLLAPLARAALTAHVDERAATTPEQLRSQVADVLASTTIDDARQVYAAIRLASPGGLGRSDEQDVAGEPTLPLTDVMRLAADRDDIAREYATTFAITFETSAPALRRAREDGLSWDDAIVETFLMLLSTRTDTHIARRGGVARAEAVSRQAEETLRHGGVRTEDGRHRIDAMHRALRTPDNMLNPGTTADLTAAAVFVDVLCGGWASAAAHAHHQREGHDAQTR